MNSSTKNNSSNSFSNFYNNLLESAENNLNWEIKDVQFWICRILEFPEYSQLFKLFGVDGEILMMLTESDLKKIGIEKIGHRKKIISSIYKLKGKEFSCLEIQQKEKIKKNII